MLAGAELEITEPQRRCDCADCGAAFETGGPPDPALPLRQRRRAGGFRPAAPDHLGKGGLTMCATCGCSDASWTPRKPDESHEHPRTSRARHEHHEHPHDHGSGERDHAGAEDPGQERRPGRRQPGLAARPRHPGRQPDELTRLGQDHPAGTDRPGPGRPADARGHRGRPGDRAGRRPHPRGGLPGGPDQHRRGLPPGRGHGRRRAAHPGPAARLGGGHRERRQPGLPGPVRPGRGRARRAGLGHRGHRQAAEVPADVPQRRPGRGDQDRPAARTWTSTSARSATTSARSARRP